MHAVLVAVRHAIERLDRTAYLADGYYVMLQPLPPGPHTIEVGARFEGSTSLSTTYHLDVR